MAIQEDAVYAALRQVRDPELLLNVVDLGLVNEVQVIESDGKSHIHVKMTLTSPACPAGPQIIEDVKDALRALGDEVGEVTVEIVLSPPWTPDRMTDEARDELGLF